MGTCFAVYIYVCVYTCVLTQTHTHTHIKLTRNHKIKECGNINGVKSENLSCNPRLAVWCESSSAGEAVVRMFWN